MSCSWVEGSVTLSEVAWHNIVAPLVRCPSEGIWCRIPGKSWDCVFQELFQTLHLPSPVKMQRPIRYIRVHQSQMRYQSNSINNFPWFFSFVENEWVPGASWTATGSIVAAGGTLSTNTKRNNFTFFWLEPEVLPPRNEELPSEWQKQTKLYSSGHL